MLRAAAVSLSIAITLTIAPVSVAQQPPARNPNAAMQEMMQRMMPGEAHRLFAQMAGKWRGKMKVWNYNTPSATATESDTQSESKLIFGGRYLMEEASGALMNMPMQRMSILGYDNLTKKYTLVFFSSMETALNVATGTSDASGKVLTFRGEFDEPEGKVPFKNVVRVDSDTHVFESYRIMPDGTERKAVEQTLTRVK